MAHVPILYVAVASATAIGGAVVAATATDWVGIIGAIGTIIVGVVGPLLLYLNRKLDAAEARRLTADSETKAALHAAEARQVAAEVQTKSSLKEIDSKLNGKLDKQIELTERAAGAEGELRRVDMQAATSSVANVDAAKEGPTKA